MPKIRKASFIAFFLCNSKTTTYSDIIVITKPGTERAADPKIIKNEAEKYIRTVVVKDNVKNALDYAKSIAKKNDMILITGSLYTVGDVKKAINRS